jgi:hypothetical protein
MHYFNKRNKCFRNCPYRDLNCLPQQLSYKYAFYVVEQQHEFARKYKLSVCMWGKCSLQVINIYC